MGGKRYNSFVHRRSDFLIRTLSDAVLVVVKSLVIPLEMLSLRPNSELR
jgi:hypothetical protein